MRTIGWARAIGAVALATAFTTAAAEPETEAAGDATAGAETWAGHQATVGARRVPILGTLVTRSDTYILATIRRDGDEVHLEQRLCKLDIAPFAGVKVSLLAEGVSKMPPTSIVFRKRGVKWEAEPWTTSWNYEDVDGDGKPGATVTVQAPICGGTVFIGSNSQAMARGVEAGGAISGELKVSVEQRILETSGGCLALVAKDTKEQVTGTFAYVPVPAGSTCATLLGSKWPAHAQPPPDPRVKEKPKERVRIR
ncbi:MAG TPA: hypothetical protein VGD74_10680 [Vulgatibacter sp.]